MLFMVVFVLAGCGLMEPDSAAPSRQGLETARTAPANKPKPAKPAPHVPITSLVGSTMAEIESSLGRPSLIREEKPAVVYEYRADGCEMRLIFFMDIERDEFRVLSYDVKAQQKRYNDLQRCVDTVAAAKSKVAS